MTGEPGHVSDGGDSWVIDKHTFVPDEDNRCTECGQPESNAGHPPLPHEAPSYPYPSLDEQATEAINGMRRLTDDVLTRSRKDWTREQWVTEAEEIMNDIDGSVLSLLNGHLMAVFEELYELRRQLGEKNG